LQTISPVPVAASFFCRNLQTEKLLGRTEASFVKLKAGKKYIVFDVGGKNFKSVCFLYDVT
jgi:hypothetical protein